MENYPEKETTYPSPESITETAETIRNWLWELLSENQPEGAPDGNIFSNDDGLGDVIETLHNLDVVAEKPRIGIVIGGGALLSCLPEIPADVIVAIDKSPFVGRWISASAEVFRQEHTPEDYKRRIFNEQNLLYAQLQRLKDARYAPIEEDAKIEQKFLGKKHFLDSQERYQECQGALARKRIITVSFDISDTAAMSKLRDVIGSGGSEVTFVNLTNVWEFTGNALGRTLRMLPFHLEASFIHSSFAYQFRRPGHSCPEAQQRIKGLEEFIREQEREYALYLSERRRKT